MKSRDSIAASAPGFHHCVNCDAPAPERFCPRCGQATRETRAPFLTLVREILDHVSLDSALPRSLFSLLLRPGRLTELYLAGKRAPYMPPVRMYLVMSLVFFVVFGITSPDVSQIDVYVGGELVGPAKPEPGTRIRKSISLLDSPDDTDWLSTQVEKWLLAGKRERFQQMDPQELVDELFRGIQRHVKLGLFVFLPLLALALRLLFLRSGSLYFDHLIFALHFQSFLFLGLSLVWVVHSPWLYAVAALVLFPLYLLLALRRVYRQKWRWIVPKFLALGLSYFVLLGLVLGGVMVVVMRGI